MSKNITSALPTGVVLHGQAYDYKITDVLGQGSFGITYRAKVEMRGALGSLDSNMYVAVKEFFMREVNGRKHTDVTNGSTAGDGLFDNYRMKFEREALNLGKLRHPNIVRVLELFRANGTVYYAMEYIAGQSLDDAILQSPGGRLAPKKAVAMARQIGGALSFMHSKGMLHLDVKPGNVMVRGDGAAILIDFGLSKQYTAGGEPESSTKVGAGTPGYAPLEQASYRDGKGFPTMMDVYALGATLFKMLTGRRPPEASDLLNDGFPLHELRQCAVPASLALIVQKAMAPLKKDRYATIDALLSALDHCDLGQTSYVRNDGEATSLDEVNVIEAVARPKRQSAVRQMPTPPEKKSNKGKLIAVGAFAAFIVVCLCFGYKATSSVDSVAPTDSVKEALADAPGYDTITYTDRSGQRLKWVGPTREGVPEGTGVLIYPSDDKDGRKTYEGQMLEGGRHDDGKATLTYTNGNCYKGTFSYDQLGTGTLLMPDDSLIYEGQFEDDKFYEGTLYHMNSDQSRGYVVNKYVKGVEQMLSTRIKNAHSTYGLR